MRHNTSGPTGGMNHNSLIEFERISVMRGPTLALDNVSLKIGIGEHVALLGPNGCGKSTLIKTITRECYPLLEGSSARIWAGRPGTSSNCARCSGSYRPTS